MYENPITCLYFLQKQNQLSVIIEKTHINIFRGACKIEINDVNEKNLSITFTRDVSIEN